jgi:multiple sugar transport system permease protein
MILAPIVVGTAWRIMYNTNYGIINYFLEILKIGGRPFLSDTSLVIPALVLTDVWQWSPLVMIIVLAALQGLPEEVYEAGKVDGASTWQVFWHITLPLLKPSLTLALLIRLMDSFRTFDIIYAMTAGGPGTSSQNLNILMYNTGFEYFQVSKTAALAIISLIMIIIASLSIIKVLRKEGAEIW